MQITYGATPNGCEKVGGWLPFVVAWNPRYDAPFVYGTTYAVRDSQVFRNRSDAVAVAHCIAIDDYAVDGSDIVGTDGCHKCYESSVGSCEFCRDV